jgi:hypothetical protein
MADPSETAVIAHLILTDATVLDGNIRTLVRFEDTLSVDDRDGMTATLRRRAAALRQRISQLPSGVASAIRAEVTPLLSAADALTDEANGKLSTSQQAALDAALEWRPSAAFATLDAIRGLDPIS